MLVDFFLFTHIVDTYQLMMGGEAAMILQSNLATCFSMTVALRGLRTKRGIASLRSVNAGKTGRITKS